MAENLSFPDTDNKAVKYESLVPQIEALVSAEEDLTANLANITAALKEGMDFFWIGFYVVKADELVLGPFQGSVACTRIKKGKGVCGTAWAIKRTITVDDVEQFTGHIACNNASKSEIVIPVMKDGKVFMVLDVDSDKLADFDEVDQQFLQRLMKTVEKKL